MSSNTTTADTAANSRRHPRGRRRPPVTLYLQSPAARTASIAALLLSAALFVLLYPRGQWPPYKVDFDVYRTGGQRFLSGHPLYDGVLTLQGNFHMPFTYPPIAAVLFAPWSLLPLWLGAMTVTAISVGCLLITIRLVLSRMIDRPASDLWWLAVPATAGCLWLQPVADTLNYGQVNVLLMMLIVIDGTLGSGARWQGVLTGLACAIKLTPLVFLLYFALRREWRTTVRAAASAVVFSTLGLVFAPSDSVKYWTTTLFETNRIGSPVYSQNQSLRGELMRLHIDSSVVWLLCAAVAAVLILWVASRLLAAGADMAALIVVGFVALYASPVSWDQHWVWAALIILVMACWAVRPGAPLVWWASASSGVALLMLVPHKKVPNRNEIELTWTWWQHIPGNAYLLWGMLTLLTIGVLAPRVPADGGSPADGGTCSAQPHEVGVDL